MEPFALSHFFLSYLNISRLLPSPLSLPLSHSPSFSCVLLSTIPLRSAPSLPRFPSLAFSSHSAPPSLSPAVGGSSRPLPVAAALAVTVRRAVTSARHGTARHGAARDGPPLGHSARCQSRTSHSRSPGAGYGCGGRGAGVETRSQARDIGVWGIRFDTDSWMPEPVTRWWKQIVGPVTMANGVRN